VRATVLGLAVVLALCACGDDTAATDQPGASTLAGVAATTEDVCEAAAGSIGAADPPADLTGVAAGAETIARSTAVGDGVDPRLVAALATVGDGARLLAAAAASEDTGAITGAAATLTSAYDELDLVAADLRLAACGSESWGRQVAIAAVELSGAGG
jgi:hypothetical protein